MPKWTQTWLHIARRSDPDIASDSGYATHINDIFRPYVNPCEWLAAEYRDRFRVFAEALSRWTFFRKNPEFLNLYMVPAFHGISLKFRYRESGPVISFIFVLTDNRTPIVDSLYVSIEMVSPTCVGHLSVDSFCAVHSASLNVASEDSCGESRLDKFLSHLASLLEGPLRRYLEPGGWDRSLWTDCRALNDEQLREFSRQAENQKATNIYDESIVGVLAHEGRCDLMKELILAGISTGEGAIGNLIACDAVDELTKLPFLELLIAHGCDVDEECQRHRESALALAAKRENISILKLLLHSGAQFVSSRSNFGVVAETLLNQALVR